MQTTSHSADFDFPKRTLYRLPDDTRELTVRRGTVWITQGNDPRDIILEPGQSFVPDGHPDVLLYVLAPAALTLRTAANTRAPWRPARPVRRARDLAIE